MITSPRGKWEKSCTLMYGVNQKHNRKQYCFAWGIAMLFDLFSCRAGWAITSAASTECLNGLSWVSCAIHGSVNEITVWKKRQTQSQPHKRTTTTFFLTLTFYSFADFFFLTAFPWDLTIGISLPCPSFRLAVSHPPFLFFSSHHSSLCFSVVFCTKQSINSVSLLHAQRFH